MDALKLMSDIGVRRMPVVGRNGTLAGILTIDDILSALAKELSQLAKVPGEGMRREERGTWTN